MARLCHPGIKVRETGSLSRHLPPSPCPLAPSCCQRACITQSTTSISNALTIHHLIYQCARNLGSPPLVVRNCMASPKSTLAECTTLPCLAIRGHVNQRGRPDVRSEHCPFPPSHRSSHSHYIHSFCYTLRHLIENGSLVTQVTLSILGSCSICCSCCASTSARGQTPRTRCRSPGLPLLTLPLGSRAHRDRACCRR